jgi:FtsP/CotA-like multicopper oxidase with cupredoxin domain
MAIPERRAAERAGGGAPRTTTRWLALLLTPCVLFGAAAARREPRALPVVVPNDNRASAGRLDGDTLRLSLAVTMARWYPGSQTGSWAAVSAFAEEGQAPRIPGPLVRVPEGTVIDVTLRNALPDSTILVGGLGTHPLPADSLIALAPGATARLRFAAGTPGTYFYFARIGKQSDLVERETAAGAFVVDPIGGSPPDRIFVINIWGDPVDSTTYREALAINGKSFPFTERIGATVGDSVRWRWINASVRPHPMHLHGFYFRVDALGDAGRWAAVAPDRRRLVVTEHMLPFTTMDVAWRPHRDGHWLFHCHLGFHVLPESQLDPPPEGSHPHFSPDFERHMAGLVLAVVVRAPPGWAEAPAPVRRRMHLYAQEGRARGRAPRALSYVLSEDGHPPAPDSVLVPGRPLVLTRGETAEITVINRMREPTAVHWHGLELESYSDGMAGWSGSGTSVAPPVMPGDSFTARLVLERAGTFMYHAHLNDLEQLTSGLYGALLVLEPGEKFDPATDHVFVLGWDGDLNPPRFLLNGDSTPPAAEVRRGVTHRLRLVNIGMAGLLRLSLMRDSTLQAWRPRARDGADLPASLMVSGPATDLLSVGQTADFLWDPPGPGSYLLRMVHRDWGLVAEQRFVVR